MFGCTPYHDVRANAGSSDVLPLRGAEYAAKRDDHPVRLDPELGEQDGLQQSLSGHLKEKCSLTDAP